MSEMEQQGVLQEVKQAAPVHNLKELEESLDGQSYFLGEVPQHQLVDPEAFLPLNSDRLIGSNIETILQEASRVIQEEMAQVAALQKQISMYEEKIGKNRETIGKNRAAIRQNSIDIIHDKKNRDYWLGRSEEVDIDYQNAASSNRREDWAWLIKKYGLKNSCGSSLDPSQAAIEELCDGESSNLIALYCETGSKYERQKKEREAENNRLFRENSSHLSLNEKLQSFIANILDKEIAPLLEGVELLKGFQQKLGALNANNTYGEMRDWAETYLNDFLKSNAKVPQKMATAFRKLASIPLPADHC